MKRVLLTTGGTGGHIFPALAVAEELRERYPDIELLFMGSDYGPEKHLAAKAEVPFVGLPVRGVLGRGLRASTALARMLLTLPKAIRIVHQFKPDCAAGFGGYAAFVPLLAARCLRVPALLHEQNAVAGSSNRLLAKLVASVCVSLPQTQGFEAKQVTLSGNPVRKSMFAVGQNERLWLYRRLIVLGGSQGAHALNELIVKALPALKAIGVEVRHQTGEQDYQWVQEAYSANGMDPTLVSPFIEDMASAYAWADLALCRSGASTVAELCATGLPAILVPFPAAIHDHQTFNAKSLAVAGAARLIPQSELCVDGLTSEVQTLFADKTLLPAMSHAALCLATPHAAATVVEQLEKLV